MQQHVKIVAVLFIIFGIFWLLLAAFFFLVGAGAAFAGASQAQSDDDRAGAMFAGGCISILATMFGIIGLPQIIAGWGLLKYRNWARILTIIIAILNLPNIPIGTAIGGYALWVLFNDETKRLFGTT